MLHFFANWLTLGMCDASFWFWQSQHLLTSWLDSIQLTSWHVHIYLDLDQNPLGDLIDPKCYGWRENGCPWEVTFREVLGSVSHNQLSQVYQISFSSWCRRLNWAWKWPVSSSPEGGNLPAATEPVSACCSVSTPPAWQQLVGKDWGKSSEKRVSLIFRWHWGYHNLAQRSGRQDLFRDAVFSCVHC